MVKLATADFMSPHMRASQLCIKNQRRCNDLILEITMLKQSIGRLSDDIEDLRQQAEALRRSGIGALTTATISALGGLAATLLRARRIARIIDRARSRDITRGQVLELLEAIGPIGAAVNLLIAIEQFREAADLERQADDIDRNGHRLGRQLLTVVDTYSRLGCGVESALV